MQTLSDLQLSTGVSQCREQVQFDAGLSAQVVLQMLSFLLHGWQSGQQHVCLFLHTAVLSKSLSRRRRRKHTHTSAVRTKCQTNTNKKTSSCGEYYRLRERQHLHTDDETASHSKNMTAAHCKTLSFCVYSISAMFFMKDLASVLACIMGRNQIPHSKMYIWPDTRQKQPYIDTAYWCDDKVQHVNLLQAKIKKTTCTHSNRCHNKNKESTQTTSSPSQLDHSQTLTGSFPKREKDTSTSLSRSTTRLSFTWYSSCSCLYSVSRSFTLFLNIWVSQCSCLV